MMAGERLVAPNSAVMPRIDRGIKGAAASRFTIALSGILDRPVKPAMTVECVATDPDSRPRPSCCRRDASDTFASDSFPP
ncbi:hypothetical protein FXB41_39290 [Bradyrhizobium canariense]|nr:hypothetical protein [Bradyrhizobium canariense]